MRRSAVDAVYVKKIGEGPPFKGEVADILIRMSAWPLPVGLIGLYALCELR